MNTTLDLFPPEIPRVSPDGRVLCVRIDATTLLDGTEAVHLVCPRCGYNRGWWKPHVLERGVECPECTPPPSPSGGGIRDGWVM